MTIVRRRATMADRSFLEATHVAALGAVAFAADGWDAAKLRDAFRADLELSVCDVIVAGGTDVGYLALEDHDDFWFIDIIAIAPAFQRCGIGSAVLRGVMRDAGALPVQLTVLHVNPLARALYERLGFRSIGTEAIRERLEWRGSP